MSILMPVARLINLRHSADHCAMLSYNARSTWAEKKIGAALCAMDKWVKHDIDQGTVWVTLRVSARDPQLDERAG